MESVMESGLRIAIKRLLSWEEGGLSYTSAEWHTRFLEDEVAALFLNVRATSWDWRHISLVMNRRWEMSPYRHQCGDILVRFDLRVGTVTVTSENDWEDGRPPKYPLVQETIYYQYTNESIAALVALPHRIRREQEEIDLLQGDSRVAVYRRQMKEVQESINKNIMDRLKRTHKVIQEVQLGAIFRANRRRIYERRTYNEGNREGGP